MDAEKFDKELPPMAAARAATTVFYGTAWDDAGLLERMKQAHLAQERRDGIRRHFEYDWQAVAASNPAYARFVAEQRGRPRRRAPAVPDASTACARCRARAACWGRRSSRCCAALTRRLEAPVAGETYVGGLDVAGEASEASKAAGHDATVLTIGRVVEGETRARRVEVVRHYAWTGVAHTALQASLTTLAREWRLQRLVVDATGIGEPVASMLAASLGSARVQALKLTAESKSSLGYGLLTAVNARPSAPVRRLQQRGDRVLARAGALPCRLSPQPDAELLRRRARRPRRLRDQPGARARRGRFRRAAAGTGPRRRQRRLDPRERSNEMVTAERRYRSRRLVLDGARRARRDALPEHTQYTDTGCDVHPSCLTCPLVRCRYDEPGGVRKVYSEDRDRAIVSMQREGVPVGAIARRFGVSRRTVFRALARGRNPSP